jgi:hypothetical protein
MGVAEDLRTLQELHGKGSLTDQEYANAKSATLKGEGGRLWGVRLHVSGLLAQKCGR